MLVTPDVIPLTIPDTLPTVATDGVVLVQKPPAVPSASATVDPWHTVELPDITAGNALTVKFTVW